ncbi:MAG: tRNA lysidine(34) synthetase TilS, partial [Chloroflexota bacterium]|nr:tRNA lysidine(34) synthetase TilS [Chloroflexota bacterium]
ALLLLLESISKKSNLKIHAVHVNHKSRKERSDNDEKLVKSLCNKINIPLTITNRPFLKEKEKTSNIENYFRESRYEEFLKIAHDTNSYGVFTAHHLNDHVETFLMKITRGSGLQGMEGINELIELNGLKIYRPLIQIPKNLLIKFCYKNNILTNYDHTNNSNAYSRNRIRNNIIPEFEKINPNFLNSINRITKIVSQINSREKIRISNELKKMEPNIKENEISFSRIIFNNMPEFDKKLMLKINSEKLSPNTFMENKHLDYIIEKSYSNNNNFSLDLPGPIKLNVSKTRITIKKLFEFNF